MTKTTWQQLNGVATFLSESFVQGRHFLNYQQTLFCSDEELIILFHAMPDSGEEDQEIYEILFILNTKDGSISCSIYNKYNNVKRTLESSPRFKNRNFSDTSNQDYYNIIDELVDHTM